jgi:hypothetical protein
MRFAYLTAIAALSIGAAAPAATVIQTFGFNISTPGPGFPQGTFKGTASFSYDDAQPFGFRNSRQQADIPFDLLLYRTPIGFAPDSASYYAELNGAMRCCQLEEFVVRAQDYRLYFRVASYDGEQPSADVFVIRDGGSFTTYQSSYFKATLDGIVPSAAPEPGAWAMLLAGFGLTGSALRRTRAVTRSRRQTA